MLHAYNPFLVAKMLDLAGHPGTPNGEALIAVRRVSDHCSSRGKTIGDAIRSMECDLFSEARSISHADLLREMAELTVARDDAEARARTQAEVIAELRRARDEDTLTIIGLRAEIAAHGEELDRQPVISPVEPVSAYDDDVPNEVDNVIEVSPAVLLSEAAGHCADHDDLIRPSEVEQLDASAHPGISSPHEPEPPVRCSWIEYALFIKLASLGRARSSIARTLCREFGKRFSISRVAKMMRQRWLSPAYLRSFRGTALAG